MRLALAIMLFPAVAGEFGSCTEAAPPPHPVMHISPATTVPTGQTVTFDSRRIDGDPPDNAGLATSYAWDLDGDGTFETGDSSVVHKAYTKPGVYSVTLEEGNSPAWKDALPVLGFLTKTVTVTAPPTQGNQAPDAAFDFSPNPGYTESKITFDASGSRDPDGQIVKYEWDWTADGTYDQTSDSPTAQHAYTPAGTYTARLRVTDGQGATNTTDRTVQVNDGVPPGKVIARAARGISAARSGTRFTATLKFIKLTPGMTTVAGAKLVTSGIKARGRMKFKPALPLFAGHVSPRWAGVLSLVQQGNGKAAKLSGQGYVLFSFTKRDSLCFAGTASGGYNGKPFTGKLAVAGGKGFGARIRGTGTFSLPTTKATTVKGRLKLTRVHRARGLPKACRTLARSL
jgi:PKD repeat protein